MKKSNLRVFMHVSVSHLKILLTIALLELKHIYQQTKMLEVHK